MNFVKLSGRVMNDPEIMKTDKKHRFVLFTIMCARPDGSGEFIDCIAWHDVASNFAEDVTKGTRISLDGKIHAKRFVKDGVERKTQDVVVHTYEVLNKPNYSYEKSIDNETS